MIVYRYGAAPPVENAARVDELLFLAHRYRNLLVEVDLARRGAARAEVDVEADVAAQLRIEAAAVAHLPACRTREVCDAVAVEDRCAPCQDRHLAHVPVAAARFAVWQGVKAERADLHPAGAADAAVTAARDQRDAGAPAKTLAKARKNAHAVLVRQRAARSTATFVQRLLVVLDNIEDRAKEFGKVARSRSGLSGSWGTYLLAEQARDAARESGKEPHFRRWDGTGRVAVQLQKGLSVTKVLEGADTRLRLAPLPDGPGSTRTGGKQEGSRRSGQRYSLMMRVGSDGRAPVWAVVPFTLHRPLPKDGVIKWAVLRRDRVGPDFRWSVQFTVVEGVMRADPEVVADRTGTVGLDIGWRARSGGLRLGYWQDDRGRHGEIALPKEVLDDLEHIRSIGAARDRLFNDFQDRLAGWTRDTSTALPSWLAREAATLPQWKSADRLTRLAWRWRNSRFPGDEAIFGPHADCPRDKNCALDCIAHVECWRYKDRHLHRWEAHGMSKILARRDEIYRCVAAEKFARCYRTVKIERFKLPGVHGRAGLDADATDGEKVRADRASSRRHMAAPGTFRLALINACHQRGTVVVEIAAAYTTQDCADCGFRNDFGAAAATSIDLRCGGCGVTWDQDRNAARNLLARHAASSPVAPGNSKALAGGKSARQQRFSQRQDRGGVTNGGADGGRSQEETEVGEIAGRGEGAVENLAQEDGT